MRERPCCLRPALPGDRDAVAAVWHAGASLPGVGPAAMPSVQQLRERLELETAAGWVVTVAVTEGAVVGFVAARPNERALAELFVQPDMLGRGIGAALLAHAAATMPEGFTLHTRASNVRARRFYEKQGMAMLGERVHPRNGDPVVRYGWPAPAR